MDTGEPIVRGVLVAIAIGAAALSVSWAQDAPPRTERPIEAVAEEDTSGSGRTDLIGNHSLTGDPQEIIDGPVPQGIDTPRMAVLQPRQQWHLVRNINFAEVWQDGRVDVHDGTSIYTLDVDRGADGDALAVRMGAHRWGGTRHLAGQLESRFDSTHPPDDQAGIVRWYAMRHYAGRIDTHGRVTSFGLAEMTDPGGQANAPNVWTDRSRACAMQSFLCDLLAYAPPVGADEGDTWVVTRPRVVLVQQRAITFLTAGATALAEQATCTLEEIEIHGEKRIGVISISCFRKLVFERSLRPPDQWNMELPEGTPRANVTITSGGQLKIDMDSGQIMHLQMTTEFLPDERCFNYVDWSNQRYLLGEHGSRKLTITADITLRPVPAAEASDEDEAPSAADPEPNQPEAS